MSVITAPGCNDPRLENSSGNTGQASSAVPLVVFCLLRSIWKGEKHSHSRKDRETENGDHTTATTLRRTKGHACDTQTLLREQGLAHAWHGAGLPTAGSSSGIQPEPKASSSRSHHCSSQTTLAGRSRNTEFPPLGPEGGTTGPSLPERLGQMAAHAQRSAPLSHGDGITRETTPEDQ